MPGGVVVICDRGVRGVASACEQARVRGAPAVVVVLREAEPGLIVDCLAAGACGFVAEDDDPRELGEAVAAAEKGAYHVAGGPLSILLDWLRVQRRSPSERSRARDRDLLELLAAGRTTAEIAERLGIAPKTVRNRASLLYRRLGVRSRAQAAVVAEERGLLD
jgi:two-component system nitrate/nitrite response regulator NarL